MEESLDAEPRLFVGQVRYEEVGRERERDKRESIALSLALAAAKKEKREDASRGQKAPGHTRDPSFGILSTWAIEALHLVRS